MLPAPTHVKSSGSSGVITNAEWISACKERVLGPGTTLGLPNTIISVSSYWKCWDAAAAWVEREVGPQH